MNITTNNVLEQINNRILYYNLIKIYYLYLKKILCQLLAILK